MKENLSENLQANQEPTNLKPSMNGKMLDQQCSNGSRVLMQKANHFMSHYFFYFFLWDQNLERSWWQ